MKIEDFNVDELVSDKYFYKKVNKEILLNDYQMDVLRRNGIDFESYATYNELFYAIDEALDEENEELESVLIELNDFYYYNYVNK